MGVTARQLCHPAHAGDIHCAALMRTDSGLDAGRRSPGDGPDFDRACFSGNAVCYTPQDLWKAYGLPATKNGKGQTIALVDAFDDPTAERDVNIYRAHYGLSKCTTASGCFTRVSQTGSTTKFPGRNAGWRGEESLDIDMASAVCPNCKIILVEANNTSFKNFRIAENQAAAMGATVISNSWSGNEWAPRDKAFEHSGITITASAGDFGYNFCASGCPGPQQPASFVSVIAVGGTSLMPDNSAVRGFTETAWNCYQDAPYACDLSTIYATGSGCSQKVAKPIWQTDTGCPRRTYNDVAAVADIVTGVWVVDNGAWYVYGGTSVASPIVAASIALAGNAKSLYGGARFWKDQGVHFFDVEQGNDVVPGTGTYGFKNTCDPTAQYICFAGPGYDGPTGWGTPNGIAGL